MHFFNRLILIISIMMLAACPAGGGDSGMSALALLGSASFSPGGGSVTPKAEMVVSVQGENKAPGTTVDLPAAVVHSNSAPVNVQLVNNGSGSLHILSVVGSGAGSGHFAVDTAALPGILEAGENAAFSVQFAPTAVGTFSTTVRITTNVSVFQLIFRGNATAAPAPEILLKMSSTSINSGSGLTIGVLSLCSSYRDYSFAIHNTGTAALILNGAPLISISGPDAARFQIVDQPEASIDPSSSSSFTIRFTPAGVGNATATFSISNNDADEALYTFSVTATGTAPDLEVRKGATVISSGGEFDLGFVPVSGTAVSSLTLFNTGTGPLYFASPAYSLTGSNNSEFAVSPGGSIAEGGNTGLSIQSKTTTHGPKAATLALYSDDCTPSPYTIQLKARAFSMTQITPSNTWSGRRSFGAVAFDGKLWMLGGQASGRLSSVYSSSNGTSWTNVTLYAPWGKRDKMETVVFNGEIWVFAGEVDVSGSVFDRPADVWKSPDGLNWSLVTDTAPWGSRTEHSVVVHDGKLWLLGGKSDYYTLKNDVWFSNDGVNWTLATASAAWSERASQASVVFDGKIWVLGGWDGTAKSDVWYSADGVTWTQAGDLPRPVSAHAAAVYDNRIFVFGGYQNTFVVPYVYASEDGLSWSTVPSSFTARDTHRAIVLNGAVWIFGGMSGTDRLNDVWKYQDL